MRKLNRETAIGSASGAAAFRGTVAAEGGLGAEVCARPPVAGVVLYALFRHGGVPFDKELVGSRPAFAPT